MYTQTHTPILVCIVLDSYTFLKNIWSFPTHTVLNRLPFVQECTNSQNHNSKGFSKTIALGLRNKISI